MKDESMASASAALQLAYFHELLAGFPDPVVLHDAEHVVIQVNPAFEQLFGYSQEESAGRQLKELIVPPGMEVELERISDELLDGRVVKLRTERFTRMKRLVPVFLTTFPVAHDGSNAGFITTYRDETESQNAAEALVRTERRYRVLFENAVEGIFMTTPEGRYLDVNPALAGIYGFDSPSELIEHFRDISQQLYVAPGRRDQYKELMLQNGEVWDFQSQIYRKDGSVIWISENSWAVYGEEGLEYYQGTVVDITERKEAQAALETQRAYFRQLFENSPQAICLLDPQGTIRDVNRGYEELFGHTAEELRGELNRKVLVPEDLQFEARMFNTSVTSGHPVQSETFRLDKRGRRVPVSVLGFPVRIGQNVAGIYYIYTDVTQRKEYEAQLSHQAFHDPLTGLPNRALFLERLDRAVERARRRPDYRFAIFMIDLNRFKLVNDSLGHQAGDRLLMETARRMAGCIRSVDTVARLGGDEFAVLLEEYARPADVTEVAERIHKIMESPFNLEGQTIVSSASIGIVLKTRDYDCAEDILRDADIAMYRAKAQDKAMYKIFNKKMHEETSENLRLENELRLAIRNGELALYYQPIVSVCEQELTGFEALVRWNHPRRGLVPPSRFIPLAEETGLIIPLGQWVLSEACRQMRQWQEEHPNTAHLTVSVNLSIRQLVQKELVPFVQSVLEETGLSPSNLKLEITESAFMQDAKVSLEVLRGLKALGIKLVVDDFGTGYSSLSYLQLMPLDMLKIDRSFISGKSSEESRQIVRTIIALARNLGLHVVAEGVEQEDQLCRLVEERCDEAQGFMFSRPLEALAAVKLLEQVKAKK